MRRSLLSGRYGIAGAALLALALSGCKSDLYTQLSERDANEMLEALYGNGLQASKVSPDAKLWTVQVEESDLQQALRVSREHGLPRSPYASTGDLFKKEGLVSTPAEERIRFIYAMSQELSNTLSQIDGVVSARVHPVIPANDPLAEKIRPSSASVFIKHRAGANVQQLAPEIKNLVMRGIEGLTYDNISLTFVSAEPAAVAARPPETTSGLWTDVAIGVLAVLLTFSAGGLAWFWSRYRRMVASASPPPRAAPAAAPVAAPSFDARATPLNEDQYFDDGPDRQSG